VADDIFSEDVDVTTHPVGEAKEETGAELNPDLVKGLQAERDPASVMPDPFAVDKSEPEDVIDKSLDQQISGIARKTGEKLNTMPKDNIIVPVDRQNPHDEYVEVAINSYVIRIKRGVKVALPRPVVDLLVSAGYGPTLVR
jgi:hypothetical protein